MRIALGSPAIARSLEDGLEKVDRLSGEASARGARIVCFPEAYLPGLRGQDFDVLPWGRAEEERVVRFACERARAHRIALILGTERIVPGGRQIAALVAGSDGTLLGVQTKNQVAPSEDEFYVPGDERRIFEVDGVRFGIAICHEGWRYPETVRWAAVRGAKVVFHPQHTGSDRQGTRLAKWGDPAAPYYEKAMTMRSIENGIYFASVNYAMRFQESATCVIGPSGECRAYLPYGNEGVLVHDLDLSEASGGLAARYAPQRYREAGGSSASDALVNRQDRAPSVDGSV